MATTVATVVGYGKSSRWRCVRRWWQWDYELTQATLSCLLVLSMHGNSWSVSQRRFWVDEGGTVGGLLGPFRICTAAVLSSLAEMGRALQIRFCKTFSHTHSLTLSLWRMCAGR